LLMKITIDEIAEMAGVSKTTVSRVLNNKPDVSPETREAILNLINQYDFTPNAMAKAITSRKSQSIGLLIPHEADYIFSNPFYVEVMRGISTEVDRLGYFLMICYPHHQNYLDVYKQKRVDGFIVLSPGSFSKDIVDTLIKSTIPFVSTSKMLGEQGLVYVDVDNFQGACLLMEHLIGLGHRRIGFIGKPSLASSVDRFNGYKSTLEKHDLPLDETCVRIAENVSIEGGYQITTDLLNLFDPPTAIFAVNDLLAIGAVRAMQDRGGKVPDDLSVVGFDDIPLAGSNNPPLTTVRQPAFEKGAKATRILIQQLEKNKKPRSIILGVELIIRRSTARNQGR
jgi:DNA-binding LacI/PurR family transcriptional regulator